MITEQAVRAAVIVAGTHGLDVSSPVVLRDLSNTLIWLRPLPLVARVGGATATIRPVFEHLARDVAVSTYLAARGVPVVGPSNLLPPGPHVHDGFTMTFHPYVEHSDQHPSPRDFAVLLAELHAELRGFEGPLPGRMPFDDIARINPDVTVPEPPMTKVQALHGDAHPGNLLMTPRGPVWNDFEDTWLGPVEWDLACLRNTQRLDGAAAVAAYPGDYDTAAVEAWFEVRRLHVAAWTQVLG